MVTVQFFELLLLLHSATFDNTACEKSQQSLKNVSKSMNQQS